jgi:ubiquinone/menaquinone biosynthesis C-methylase UbiE
MLSQLRAIVGHPTTYDLVQRAAGADRLRRWIAGYLADCRGDSLLDLGAGTGSIRSLLPADTQYIWFDNDPQKLAGYRSRRSSGLAVLGDGSRLCFAAKSVDHALSIAVSHHLDHLQLRSFFREISRVTRKRLYFVDALQCSPPRLLSKALWAIDRGSFPRTPDVLRELINEHFIIEQTDTLQVLHRYLLCIARPRR